MTSNPISIILFIIACITTVMVSGSGQTGSVTAAGASLGAFRPAAGQPKAAVTTNSAPQQRPLAPAAQAVVPPTVAGAAQRSMASANPSAPAAVPITAAKAAPAPITAAAPAVVPATAAKAPATPTPAKAEVKVDNLFDTEATVTILVRDDQSNNGQAILIDQPQAWWSTWLGGSSTAKNAELKLFETNLDKRDLIKEKECFGKIVTDATDTSKPPIIVFRRSVSISELGTELGKLANRTFCVVKVSPGTQVSLQTPSR